MVLVEPEKRIITNSVDIQETPLGQEVFRRTLRSMLIRPFNVVRGALRKGSPKSNEAFTLSELLLQLMKDTQGVTVMARTVLHHSEIQDVVISFPPFFRKSDTGQRRWHEVELSLVTGETEDGVVKRVLDIKGTRVRDTNSGGVGFDPMSLGIRISQIGEGGGKFGILDINEQGEYMAIKKIEVPEAYSDRLALLCESVSKTYTQLMQAA